MNDRLVTLCTYLIMCYVLAKICFVDDSLGVFELRGLKRILHFDNALLFGFIIDGI